MLDLRIASAATLFLGCALACSAEHREQRDGTAGTPEAGRANGGATDLAGGVANSSDGVAGSRAGSFGGTTGKGGVGGSILGGASGSILGGAGGAILGGASSTILGGAGGAILGGAGGSILGGASSTILGGAGGAILGGAGAGTNQQGGTAATAGSGGQGGTIALGGASSGPSGGRSGGSSGGAVSVGGSSSNGGSSGVGGAQTGGALPTGGTGTAGGSNPGVDPSSGIHGRIVVTVASTTSGAEARANFYDRPMRMDAFDPFPPALHELVLAQDGCVLTKAALRACSPPCGANQYCGLGDVCAPAAQVQSAGTISLQGPVGTVQLSPVNSSYAPQSISAANITPTDLLSVDASGGAVPAFSLSSLGVTTADIGLPGGTASTFQLVDGQDKIFTWTPTATGTVQLLLNSGWHGATPTATLICEAPAIAGRLVVPRVIVEAYPPETGGGLLTHTSTVSLLQRQRVTSGGYVIELLVVGYRGVIQPIH
jgi:hypothetical protein